jgi:hypothetical protein
VHFKTICCSESSRPWLLPTLTGSFGHVMISTMKDKIKLVFFSYYVYHCPSPARDDIPMQSYHDIHLLTRSFLTSSQRVAPKRKYICPGRLYKRGTLDWAVRPKPLNEAIPERGFEDSEFIPNLPNRLVVEFIWPKIFKEEKRNSQLIHMPGLELFEFTTTSSASQLINHCNVRQKGESGGRIVCPLSGYIGPKLKIIQLRPPSFSHLLMQVYGCTV